MSDLLKVLDMTEEEQITWLAGEGVVKLTGKVGQMIPVESLADLAFRLRDEARADLRGEIDFRKGMAKVYYTVHKLPENSVAVFSIYIWFVEEAKPIHWIVAALIAKESE